MKKKEEIRNELEKIRKVHRGILKPIDVVKTAINPKNILHNKFQWDDSKAGHAYRLWQARQLIETVVEIIDSDLPPIDAYVSLIKDRKKPDGGYRSIITVMKNVNLRKELLAQALFEFKRLEAKYKQLIELVPIFEAIKKVEKVA